MVLVLSVVPGLQSSQPSTHPPRLMLPLALGGTLSWLSSAYIIQASVSCFWFDMHLMPNAFILALPQAGSTTAAGIARMAMTTSNSISVKPRCVACKAEGFGVVFITQQITERICKINLVFHASRGGEDRLLQRKSRLSNEPVHPGSGAG